MLVLSRTLNERIVIPLPSGQVIRVKVCEIRGGKIRIGVEAPSELPVHREEVYEEIQAQQRRGGGNQAA